MIRAENLTKRYGLITAIDDVTFEVAKGEILGFLGPNGAGKTTTMRVLAGFFPATQGKAVVAGYDVFKQPLEAKKRLGYLPEHPPVYTEMIVDDYLRFVGTIKGVDKSRLTSRMGEVKERCGLVGEGDRLIKHLSKGFQQRVGLAQALIHEPEVLILDEPTVGLDPKQIIEVRELIKELAGDHTVILSTHILPEVSMTCQRVVIINNARIVAIDTPENLNSQLRGGDVIELEVRGPIERLESAFRDLPQVIKVTLGQERDGYYPVSLETSGKEDIRHEVAKRIIHSGLDLCELKTLTMTLEEIFVKLTTEEEAA